MEAAAGRPFERGDGGDVGAGKRDQVDVKVAPAALLTPAPPPLPTRPQVQTGTMRTRTLLAVALLGALVGAAHAAK